MKVKVFKADLLIDMYGKDIVNGDTAEFRKYGKLRSLIIANIYMKSLLGETSTDINKLVKGYDVVDVTKKYSEIESDMKKYFKTDKIFIGENMKLSEEVLNLIREDVYDDLKKALKKDKKKNKGWTSPFGHYGFNVSQPNDMDDDDAEDDDDMDDSGEGGEGEAPIAESDKPVNYTVKGVIHFKDGTENANQGKIKATSAQEAEKEMRAKIMNGSWNSDGAVKSFEIISIKRG